MNKISNVYRFGTIDLPATNAIKGKLKRIFGKKNHFIIGLFLTRICLLLNEPWKRTQEEELILFISDCSRQVSNDKNKYRLIKLISQLSLLIEPKNGVIFHKIITCEKDLLALRPEKHHSVFIIDDTKRWVCTDNDGINPTYLKAIERFPKSNFIRIC
jgi:hypothetical protein